MWDIRSHLLIQHYAAHEGPVTSLSLHDSGYYLLSASRDSTLKIWDLREGRLLFTMQSHIGPINAASFSKDGHFFASGGTDELVMVWKSNLYGLKAPDIDWGMGERPKSAPVITNGNGVAVRSEQTPNRTRSSVEIEEEGNTSSEKVGKELRISRKSVATLTTNDSTGTPYVRHSRSAPSPNRLRARPAPAPSAPSPIASAHKKSSNSRDESTERLVSRNELPANLTKTLDHIIGQVSHCQQNCNFFSNIYCSWIS